MKNFYLNLVNKNYQPGYIFFYIGLLLLPAAFSVSSIFLLISIIFSFKKFKLIYVEDRWNYFFLISFLLLIFSGFINFIDKSSINNLNSNPFLNLLGLFNWIPLFLAYIGFRPYLSTTDLRKRCSIFLILGTIPVIFSIIAQMLLDWHGPISTLFGLIVWYQRPIDGIIGITGLFSNPNYLGSWLNIIWPFVISLIFFSRDNFIKLLSFLFTTLIVFFIILTASRSAWICLVITLLLLSRNKFNKWLITLFILITILILGISFPIFGERIQFFLQSIIPKGLWINFTSLGYESLDVSRIKIWESAYRMIAEKPFFGHGSSAFSSLFFNETGLWKGHAHNLPLELMVNYGLPAALLIIFPVTYFIYKAFKFTFFSNKSINRETITDRAWIISLTLLVFMHLVDIQYFDGRISISGWVLVSGVREIIRDQGVSLDLNTLKSNPEK